MATKDVKLQYCYNGIDYVCQCLPSPIVELNKSIDNLMETLDEASDTAKDILKMVPTPDLKNCFKLALKSVTTARSLCEKAVGQQVQQTWQTSCLPR